MNNLEFYKNLIRLLEARLEEMKEEKRLTNKLLTIYHKEIKQLESKGETNDKEKNEN